MYLGAALQSQGSSLPVKIRNMSSTGAAVEGSVVAEPGTSVRLVRGGLRAEATVVWSREGRCGLRFAGPVSVPKWRAPPANPHQERVDLLVAQVRAGHVPSTRVPSEPNQPSGPVGTAQLADDLGQVSDLLLGLADELLCDLAVLAAHGSALQNLDIAVQSIDAIRALLSPGDHPNADAATRLESLRVSAAQALR
jgi:hypothetical protein